jgi:hypothetical protein
MVMAQPTQPKTGFLRFRPFMGPHLKGSKGSIPAV